MAKQIKFTIGSVASGYKTVEVAIDGTKVFCKILRSGLLDGGKKISSAVKVSDEFLKELDELEIFSWEENYSSDIGGGMQWELIFKDGNKIYRGRGIDAYPENWERFLDWLDALFPELEFVYRKRLERVTIEFAEEHLVLDRSDKTLTLDKKFSAHTYDVGEDTKKTFDACQKFFDNIERKTSDINFSSRAKFELLHHNGSVEIFETPYNENFLPGLAEFVEAIHAVANDLTAEIFAVEGFKSSSQHDKYILCKVQFPGNYKHYTYSTDDETLAVGDIVDVPVGRDNEIRQARIADIGYFDEYEAPLSIERIKKIIGKHATEDWENY